MIRRLLVIFLFLFICALSLSGQTANPGELRIVDSYADYFSGIKADSSTRLVEIIKYIPDIKLDIRYATRNNFTGQAVYTEARAFARLPVVITLAAVQQELKEKGLGLKIYDAYRPYSVTVKFFEIATDKSFVASPKTGSRHNRGCAIDMTLIKLKTGKELKMPTPYDSFAPEASAKFNDLPKRARVNRNTLIQVMEAHGFKVLNNEWWHFDFNGWKDFDLMNIPFNKL
ncbi:M15 family metallopeptidase [Flavihumibacter sp. R14]|nr:M15 family metallopeptidase [Flavihumibacter soli]